MQNLYQSPASNVVAPVRRERANERLDDVAYGQKSIIYAIVLYFVASTIFAALGPQSLVLALVAILISIGLAWSGIYKVSRGLEYPFWLRLMFLLFTLAPGVGLIALLFLNSRATARLEKAGYRVGLLGARY